MALTDREKANRAMAQRREEEARRRKQGSVDKVSVKPVGRQVVDQAAADDDEAPKDILIKGMTKEMRDRLERERVRLGLRSRAATIMAVLDEAVPK